MTTDQSATVVEPNLDADRQIRREGLFVLLSRLQRGRVLSPDEAALLRAHVATEVNEANQAHAALDQAAKARATFARRLDTATERLRKARQQRDDAQAEATRLQKTIAHVADAPLNGDMWARLGMALGWTPERAGTEARKRRLHGERVLAENGATAEREHDAHRLDLADALLRSRVTPWPKLIERAAEAQRESAQLWRKVDEQIAGTQTGGAGTHWPLLGIDYGGGPLVTGQRLTADRIAEDHEAHRRALAEALNCPASANWRHLTAYAAETQKSMARNEKRIDDRVKQLAETEQALTEAVRQRKAAEDRSRATAATLRTTADQLADARRRDVCRCSLAPFTAPVSPREMRPISGKHPLFALTAALEGPPVQHYEAASLVKAYYDAITSAPPAEAKQSSSTSASAPADVLTEQAVALPLELDGAAIWAAVRDLAAKDDAWWREVEGIRSAAPARFPVNLLGDRPFRLRNLG